MQMQCLVAHFFCALQCHGENNLLIFIIIMFVLVAYIKYMSFLYFLLCQACEKTLSIRWNYQIILCDNSD